MRNLKLVLLIIFCVSVVFVQSEKLPYKILPKYLDVSIKIKNTEAIAGGIIQVLTYNTWGLPIALSGHDQERRFDLLPKSILNTNSDIISLQETFHPWLRENLLAVLPKKYYTYSDYRCNRPIIPFVNMDCHGGLMTLSIYPIVDEQFFLYPKDESYSMIERIGSKGFLVSQIQHGEQDVFVINTHLYAGNDKKSEEIRMKQIKYLHEILVNTKKYEGAKFILTGDFNIHHPDVACSGVYDFIVGTMGFSDSKPTIDKEDYTIDMLTNKYVPAKERGTKLDYIFLKSNTVQPIKILNQSRTMTSDQTLSDHYGWHAFLKI